MANKIREERQHHREAFEMYYLMPEKDRSMRALAKILGKAASTVQSWSDSFDWKERIEIRDAQVRKQFQTLQQQNNDSLVEIKAQYHKLLKVLIAGAIDSIKGKKLKIESVNDLLRVMEMDMKLLGEEDRQAHNQLEDLTKALQTSAQMFGMNPSDYVYDGNDRIETGEDNDSNSTTTAE